MPKHDGGKSQGKKINVVAMGFRQIMGSSCDGASYTTV